MNAALSTRRYTRYPDIVFRRVGDELLLVPIRQRAADVQSIYSLNETGGWIWEAIDGHRTVGEIVDMLTEEYEIGRPQAEADLEELMRDLERIEAITEVS